MLKKIFQNSNICMVKIQFLTYIWKWAHMVHNPLCRICFFVSTPTVYRAIPRLTPVTWELRRRVTWLDLDGGKFGQISPEIDLGWWVVISNTGTPNPGWKSSRSQSKPAIFNFPRFLGCAELEWRLEARIHVLLLVVSANLRVWVTNIEPCMNDFF
jgi:hypothetical protein